MSETQTVGTSFIILGSMIFLIFTSLLLLTPIITADSGWKIWNLSNGTIPTLVFATSLIALGLVLLNVDRLLSRFLELFILSREGSDQDGQDSFEIPTTRRLIGKVIMLVAIIALIFIMIMPILFIIP